MIYPKFLLMILMITKAGYLPFNAVVRYLLTMGALDWFPNQIAQDAARFFELSEAKLQQREALEAEIQKADKSIPRRDLFHYLLNSQDPVTGKSFTKSQVCWDKLLLLRGLTSIIAACRFWTVYCSRLRWCGDGSFCCIVLPVSKPIDAGCSYTGNTIIF